ncbi:MAG: ADP-ribosylglycohydrolase family protein [Clostridia bacterium]|nr:ADP-ribosylglycohydrolase family protein [Clostridia bacterium]
MKNRIKDAIIGLCVGDALGVPVEFMTREALKFDPVTDMREYGTYHKPRGTWSDDTSMTLCLLDSLASGLEYEDIMKKFVSWYKEGAYTQYGEAFDIGMCTRESIQRYLNGVEPLECGGIGERDNGNGSLMRILPLLFYLQYHYEPDFQRNDEVFEVIHNVSGLTHGHKRSQVGCGIYLSLASMLTEQKDLKRALKSGIERAFDYYNDKEDFKEESKAYHRLLNENFDLLDEAQIKSSGYVVDSLEAAVWCLMNTQSYAECVLKAVNLGEDTDTVAAIAGGLAGLYYGLEQIPVEWVDAILNRELIFDLSDHLFGALISEKIKTISIYIPYFEIANGRTVCNYRNGYPDYDQTMLDFVSAVEMSNLMDHAYLKTVEKYGINDWNVNTLLDNFLKVQIFVIHRSHIPQ